MSDQFLYDSRPTVDERFAEDLYSRISRRSDPGAKEDMRRPLARMSALAVAILAFVILLLAAFPTARAEARRWIREISQRLSSGDSQLIGDIIVINTDESELTIPTKIPGAPTFEPITILVADLDQVFGPVVRVPDMPPAGCGLDPKAIVHNIDDQPTALLTWNCQFEQGAHTITLYIFDGGMIAHLPKGSYREVDLGGQEALLIRGIWMDVEGEMSWEEGLIRIAWAENNLLYELSSAGNAVDESSLIRMASSGR